MHFKPEHGKFWSNFEFDRNIVSGTGAWSVLHIMTQYTSQTLGVLVLLSGYNKVVIVLQMRFSNLFSCVEIARF